MTRIIRKTYPKDFSLGILAIIFVLVFFLSGQLFEKRQPEYEGFINIYMAEFLVSSAVTIMILILWEEILFPVSIKPEDGGLVFRNHKRKLVIQALIYLLIPAIVIFLFLTYNVNDFRFFIWAGVVIVLPIAGKLISGINNYNDFLKLTPDFIEYKDNEMEGRFNVAEIQKIRILKDDHDEIRQLELNLHSSSPITINIFQMELEDFYDSIEEYINKNYKNLLGS